MGSPPPRRRGQFAGDPAGGSERGTLAAAVRGQSVALEYTLALGVASLVITGLFLAAGDFVTSQREQVVRTELGVVGEQLAGEVVSADRLVRAGESTSTLSINASLPRTIAGAGYVVEVANTGGGASQWLNLTTRDPEVSVAVRLETATDLAPTRVQGGRIEIRYDPVADRLEVRG
jgi:hypothetical protein